MTIYISDELTNIKDELINRGYNVISNSNNTPCDAIICNLKNGGLLNINNISSAKKEGTLIIDCGSKSIEEIEYILNNRTYSSIF